MHNGMQQSNDSSASVERRDRFVLASATVTLSAYQQLVLVSAGTYTITLPKVAEAAGKIYTLRAKGTITGTVTIVSAGDVPLAVSLTGMATDKAYTLYSDGLQWYSITTQLNP